MTQRHSLYSMALVTAQDLAARLARVQESVHALLASSLPQPLGGWLVPRQLAQVYHMMPGLTELLAHVEGQELVQCVTLLLEHARGMVQDGAVLGAPSQEALRHVAQQLELAQAALQALLLLLQ